MTTFSSRDHAAFKEFEFSGWERAAEEYHHCWGHLTVQAIAPLLDAAGVSPGKKVLDIATGAGYAAAAAAARGATVSGMDFSPAQVALARRKYPTIEFDEGDMEALPYADGYYDAVVMNFGLLHSLRPERVVAEAFRVIKPGGRFASTVWAAPEVSAGFRILLGAIEKYGTMDVALPPAQPYFRFSDKRESHALLSQAGFEHLHFEIVQLVWQLASAEQMFQAFYHGAVRAAAILRSQSKTALDAIQPHILREVEAFKAIGGGLEVPMGAALTAGTRPQLS